MARNVTITADKIGLARGSKRAGIALTKSASGTTVNAFFSADQVAPFVTTAFFLGRAADDPTLIQPGTTEINISNTASIEGPLLAVAPPNLPDHENLAVLHFNVGKVPLQVIAQKDVWRRELSRLPILGQPQSKEFQITIGKNGIWQTGHFDELAAAEAMSDAPERAVALIGATMIENRLKKAIIAHTLTNSEVQKDMFAVGAPFADFRPRSTSPICCKSSPKQRILTSRKWLGFAINLRIGLMLATSNLTRKFKNTSWDCS